MPKIGAFIFDMDGVIIDSEPIHSRVKLDTFAHFGIPFRAEDLARYMGRTSGAIFRDALAACGCLSSFTHSKDYSCSTENDVSTCPNFSMVCSLLFVYKDVSAFVSIETWSCAYEKWV